MADESMAGTSEQELDRRPAEEARCTEEADSRTDVEGDRE